MSGYIDDSQIATIAALMQVVKVALLLLVDVVGVQLSVDKLQWAREDPFSLQDKSQSLS